MTQAPPPAPDPGPEALRPPRPVDQYAGGPESDLPSNLAILPSRDAVLYPGMLLPMQASEERWVRLLSDAVSVRQPIGVALQRDAAAEFKDIANVYPIGTAANVVRLLKLP